MADSQRTVVLVVVVAFLVLVGLPLLWGSLMMGGSMMGPGMMGPMMGGWWAGGNPWWGILSFIFGAVALVGIALLVIWAVRQFGPGEAGSQQPLEILRERYARGDITRAQYEQMRSDLE